jgi:hypothetical protein
MSDVPSNMIPDGDVVVGQACPECGKPCVEIIEVPDGQPQTVYVHEWIPTSRPGEAEAVECTVVDPEFRPGD